MTQLEQLIFNKVHILFCDVRGLTLDWNNNDKYISRVDKVNCIRYSSVGSEDDLILGDVCLDFYQKNLYVYFIVYQECTIPIVETDFVNQYKRVFERLSLLLEEDHETVLHIISDSDNVNTHITKYIPPNDQLSFIKRVIKSLPYKNIIEV